MAAMNVIRRKYNSEVPENAFYKQPTASMPARRQQIKINPEGKTSFGPDELIRIHIPPQGYLDPEFSYLSFDVKVRCPETYCLKALEVWNSQANSTVYDTGLNSTLACGKAGSVSDGTTTYTCAKPVPIMREKQIPSADTSSTPDQFLYEYVPVGQVYPVLPFSTHGFFNRVIIRSANNTPIEDVQDYDYLCAVLGDLTKSSAYSNSVGSVLEGWGDENTRAKLALACVENLTYIRPATFQDNSPVQGLGNAFTYKYSGTYTDRQAAKGLSPEGVEGYTTGEAMGGMKFTCNLNLGLLQQGVHLPLLFSGGIIIELYTNSFERCFGFKSLYGRLEATDMPNLADAGIINGNHGEVVDITAQSCVLPSALTSKLGWIDEPSRYYPSSSAADVEGKFLHTGFCPYAIDKALIDSNTAAQANNIYSMNDSSAHFLTQGSNGGGQSKLASYLKQNYYTVTDTSTGAISSVQTGDPAQHFVQNYTRLATRYTQFLNQGTWSYRLDNVEFRGDMLQYSQAYDEGTADVVDRPEGLPITFQTFATQKNIYNGQRQTITMNERARAIQYALAVFKNPEHEKTTHILVGDNDSRTTAAVTNFIPINNIVTHPTQPFGTLYNGVDLNWTQDAGSGQTPPPADNVGFANYDFYNPTPDEQRALGLRGDCLWRPRYNTAAAKGYGTVGGSKFIMACARRKFVTFSNPWNAIMRVVPIDAQTQNYFPELVDYQFRVGTRFIPASPVDCQRGAVQAYIELMKAIGFYGTFTSDSARLNIAGNSIHPEEYSKRISTDSKVVSGAYSTSKALGQLGTIKFLPFEQTSAILARDYLGNRYKTPTKFVLGQNFSDITEFASGLDTATQALSVELALNGNVSSTSGVNQPQTMNCYVFLNVRRDLYIRCGGQLEILY